MATSNRSPEFKRLQREWDQKLKDSGFEEIEDRESPREFLKRWHGSYFRSTWSEAREAYFQKASSFLNWYGFSSILERAVWQKHSEGRTLREIEKETVAGRRISKDRAHKIIRALQEIMLAYAVPDEPGEHVLIAVNARQIRKRG